MQRHTMSRNVLTGNTGLSLRKAYPAHPSPLEQTSVQEHAASSTVLAASTCPLLLQLTHNQILHPGRPVLVLFFSLESRYHEASRQTVKQAPYMSGWPNRICRLCKCPLGLPLDLWARTGALFVKTPSGPLSPPANCDIP